MHTDEHKDITQTPKATILETDRLNLIIPQCCREGWASCKHVVKKQKPAKRNVGL